VGAFDELDTPGGNICEPNDVALDSRHLVQNFALITLSDKVFEGVPISETAARDSIEMGEILFGGREAIEELKAFVRRRGVELGDEAPF